MTRHLAKLFEMLWYASMGLFLGLHAGTILAVVETFDSSRKIDATPGLVPYADPQFAQTHNEIVAGFIAQNMFKNGGVVALVLLGVAVLARVAYTLISGYCNARKTGSRTIGSIRACSLILCAGLMVYGAGHMMQMNRDWPGLYETDADPATLEQRRAEFDKAHKTSERVVGAAWFLGALALVSSPWCRRLRDPSPEPESNGQS